MGFHTRAEWSDRRLTLPAAGWQVGTAVVHHTVAEWHPSQDKAAWLRGLEHSVTDHVAPGNSNPLIAIDYNEMIFPDGDVWEGRGLDAEDAATYHYNAQSCSWGLIGNYDTHQPTPEMIRALSWRINVAIERHRLHESPRIIGHRDVGTFATACPGRFMEARLGEVRALVSIGIPGIIEDMTEEEHNWLATTALQSTATLQTVTRIEKRISRQGWISRQLARINRNTTGNTPPA